MEKIKKATEYALSQTNLFQGRTRCKNEEDIKKKFNLTEKETKRVYDLWKKNFMGIEKCTPKTPTRIKEEKTRYGEKKIKAIYEKYLNGVESKVLAREEGTTQQKLIAVFRYYKKKGVLNGNKKRHINKKVKIGKKEIDFSAFTKLYLRYLNGEKIKTLASEMNINGQTLSNKFSYYRGIGLLVMPDDYKKKKRDSIYIDGKIFTMDEFKMLYNRHLNGETIAALARERKIDKALLSNRFKYYRDRNLLSEDIRKEIKIGKYELTKEEFKKIHKDYENGKPIDILAKELKGVAK